MNTEPLQDLFARDDQRVTQIETTNLLKTVTESGSDYLLPDYLGDVRRILSIEVDVIPSGKYQSGDTVEFAGILSYRILYADAENRLTEARFTSDYDFSAPVDRETYLDSTAKVSVASCTVRLAGPRKFIAKASLSCEIGIKNETELAPFDDLPEEAKPEVDTRTVLILSKMHGQSAEREYAEEAYVKEGITSDALQVVGTSGGLRIDSVKPAESGVNVTGYLLLQAILQENENDPFPIEKEIPFEQNVPIEGIDPNAKCTAAGVITSFTASVNPSDSGAAVTFNVIVECEASVYRNAEAKIVTDAFLCSAPTKAVYGPFAYTEFCDASVETACVEGEAPLSEVGIESVTDVLFSDASVKIESTAVTDGEVTVKGTVCFRAVVLTEEEDGRPIYQNPRFETDFSLSVKSAAPVSACAIASCVFKPFKTTVTLDRDKIYGRCEGNLTPVLTEEKEMTRLVSLTALPNENYAPTAGTVKVYYPTENDTLFAVAKKYHIPTAKIAAENALSAEVSMEPGVSTLASVRKLIIR